MACDECAGCTECPFDGSDVPVDLHEIHVTVQGDPERFKTVCESNGIKPIVIAYTGRGKPMMDVMTSQPYKGPCEGALDYATGIAELLQDEGFPTIRIKIETTPFNPIRHKTKGGYFESHVAAYVPVEQEDEFRTMLESYQTVRTGQPVHVSRNAFRRDGNVKKIMVTFRLYSNDVGLFQDDAFDLDNFIQSSGYLTDRVITEFCWHDSRVNHDDAWMGVSDNSEA